MTRAMTRAPFRYAFAFSIVLSPSLHFASSGAIAGAASLNASQYRAGIPAANDAIAGIASPEASNDASDDEINKISAKKLSGSVHMAAQKETALATVLIEECDPSWSRVLGSTQTDYQGNFKLKPAKRGKVHYLRLSAKGFYTRHYEVTLSSDAPDQLKLELQLASRSRAGTGRIHQSKFSLS
jgi:hypothetical protein